MDPQSYIVPMHPEESYSRQLDERVAAQELPYGYDGNPPPYWHENAASVEQMYHKERK